MTHRRQNGTRMLYFSAILALMTLFTGALASAASSVDAPRTFRFEVRLASHEKVEGWKMVPGPAPGKAFIWISPEAALTNADVLLAELQLLGDEYCVSLLFTEDGALKLAGLTKAHIGEFTALMIDGRVTSVPKIMAEIINGRALINGDFTEEEAGSIAAGIAIR